MTEWDAKFAPARHAAQRLHQRFGLRERLSERGGRMPVFDMLVRCGLTPLVRPLNQLLGAHLVEPVPGVVIAAQLSRNRQRFAGACLLGHALLARGNGHGRSLLLRGSPEAEIADAGELAGRAFAEEFLLPSWLLEGQCGRQGWTPGALADPAVAYQLALRLGVDYKTLCRRLLRLGAGMIGRDVAVRLRRAALAEIKAGLLRDAASVVGAGDVWMLTPRDEGAVIEGGPEDLFVLCLPERSGAGFVWNLEQLRESGFAVIRDERVAPERAEVGGNVDRLVTVSPTVRRKGKMVLAERRPWERSGRPLREFHVRYRLTGPEPEGWARAARELIFSA